MQKSKDWTAPVPAPTPAAPGRGLAPGGPFRAVDVQLLALFEAVHRTRNVSQACGELGLSQPAGSRALARLRAVYDDPLFVRRQTGVIPTPRAEALAPQLAAALDLLRATVAPPAFAPATVQRDFVVAMSDVGERYFLPSLLQRLQAEAPGVSLRSLTPSGPELVDGLASGAIDLAAGFLPPLGKQCHVERLFEERFVYIARKGHRVLQAPVTQAVLRTLPHALACPPGTPHAAAVERALTVGRARVPIAMRVASFLSVAPLVADTDLVALVPSNLARSVASHLPVQTFAPPVAMPRFTVALAWHQRFHRDPANAWLRGLFASLFRPLSPRSR